jgi:hypothetical protein
MFGRTILGVLGVIALVALVAFMGQSVYNAGVSQGLADAAISAAASGDPVPVVVAPYGGHYGYGYGGPGIFGIFFWILGFFLIFGLLRAAFGWGRWGGGGPGRRGWESRQERMSELHRELHRREDQASGSAG